MLTTKYRPCGDCHRCCEGHLWGSAYGHQFRTGKPCGWLGQGGCVIYPNHPQDPCKSFICGWKENQIWPEYLRPNISNVIFVTRRLDEHLYWNGVLCKEFPTVKTLEWIRRHQQQTEENFLILKDSKTFVCFTSNIHFLSKVRKQYSEYTVSWQN